MEPRTGVHPFIEIDLLGVDMAIEVDDPHLLVAEVSANPTDCWKTNGVITTQEDWEGPAGKDVGDPLGDLIEAFLVVGRDGEDITHITEGDLLAQIHTHLVVVRGVER